MTELFARRYVRRCLPPAALLPPMRMMQRHYSTGLPSAARPRNGSDGYTFPMFENVERLYSMRNRQPYSKRVFCR
jgi:hypothetical protein